MTAEEVSDLYISRAQEMEKDGKYKEAERLMQTDERLRLPTVVSFHIIDTITFKQKGENLMFVHVDSSQW